MDGAAQSRKQLRDAIYYANNRDRIRDQHAQWRTTNPEKVLRLRISHRISQMLYGAKRRAQAQGVPFAITLADIEVPTHCPVLGLRLEYGEGRPRPESPTLDKLIPELGYVPGNVAVISFRANLIKQDATAEEIARVAEWVRSKRPT